MKIRFTLRATLAANLIFSGPSARAAGGPVKLSPSPKVSLKPSPKPSPKVSPTPSPTQTPSPTPVPKLSVAKNAPRSERPFWKLKPDLEKKMSEQRAILVSVQQTDLPSGKTALKMVGVGHIQRPKETCFLLAQDYPRLKEVSDHFREVNYDAATSRLFVITEALGYQSRMLLKLTPVSEDWRSEIQFEVIWGHFLGMKGVIGFEKIGPRATEVSFTADYQAENLPIPKILIGFALEIITQKVAEKMRAHIESNSK